jgi:hypothetical protein
LNGVYFNFKSDILVFSYANFNRREFFLRKLKPNDLSRIECIVLKRGDLPIMPRLVGLKEIVFDVQSRFFSHEHISSCSTRDGSIHTLEELLESNPDGSRLCCHLKQIPTCLGFSKEKFEKSEGGSEISIRLGYLCMRGVPKEGNSFYFR